MIAVTAAGLATTRVAVKLEGDVEPECAVSANFASGATLHVAAAVDVPDVTKAGSKDFSFTVNCNAPFHYVTGSTAGSTAPLVAGPYGDTLTVTLNPV